MTIVFQKLIIFVPKIDKNSMKIVVDEKIPYICEALTEMGHSVVAKAGSSICPDDVREAGALFVRTRTACNADLLEGSSVRFVGTATIGYDHIDNDYCRSRGICWCSAPACNAGGVLQYVQSSIYAWLGSRPLRGLTLGVVGVGAIGSRVAAWAAAQGMRVLLNDPPREASGEEGFVSLETVARESDIVTFHPTLTRGGEYPSFHLGNDRFFASLQRMPLVINASRGAVVDNAAILDAFRQKKIAGIVLDVWEGEPLIDRELLDAAFIATPHIAGYSAEGKYNATEIVLRKFAEYTDYKGALPIAPLAAPADPVVVADCEAAALLGIYNPLNDTAGLKRAPHLFEELRNNYNFRREPSAYEIRLEYCP